MLHIVILSLLLLNLDFYLLHGRLGAYKSSNSVLVARWQTERFRRTPRSSHNHPKNGRRHSRQLPRKHTHTTSHLGNRHADRTRGCHKQEINSVAGTRYESAAGASNERPRVHGALPHKPSCLSPGAIPHNPNSTNRSSISYIFTGQSTQSGTERVIALCCIRPDLDSEAGEELVQARLPAPARSRCSLVGTVVIRKSALTTYLSPVKVISASS
ncbi:hypothetical protein B0T18DRAFT_402541 [Schizothecium vesticola]|uniref:Secreted protein n=1 Tax=Schizothecium vesticola TaxID=314040 RepID=A0AA40F575_9PEZI|nr:hypothetical protein B0T18DRAFT_402541 [Schizothecium vesticola]